MACRYYDAKTKMCKRSTQLVPVAQDRITQYCKGNYKRCPSIDSDKTSFSWDERAANRKAKERGDNIRLVAPVVFVAVLLLCLFKVQMDLLPSVGAAMFAGLVVLMFTNRYH